MICQEEETMAIIIWEEATWDSFEGGEIWDLIWVAMNSIGVTPTTCLDIIVGVTEMTRSTGCTVPTLEVEEGDPPEGGEVGIIYRYCSGAEIRHLLHSYLHYSMFTRSFCRDSLIDDHGVLYEENVIFFCYLPTPGNLQFVICKNM